MSLVIAIKSPEGLVLGAESRVTYHRIEDAVDPTTNLPIRVFVPITFDNATKLLSFDTHKYVGAVTYDVGGIGERTANSFVTEFLAEIGPLDKAEKNRLTIKEFSQKLSDFYVKRWADANNTQAVGAGKNMRFIIGGFDKDKPYAEVYEITVPDDPTPIHKSSKDSFDVLWGGQREIVDRIFNAIDPGFQAKIEQELAPTAEQKKKIVEHQREFALPIIPRTLALQDCVKLGLTLIRTTIDLQSLAYAPRSVGGHIDIATITKEDGLEFIQQKKVSSGAE
jgi:hypothetical protein